jgi:hypothetical protein
MKGRSAETARQSPKESSRGPRARRRGPLGMLKAVAQFVRRATTSQLYEWHSLLNHVGAPSKVRRVGFRRQAQIVARRSIDHRLSNAHK